MTDEHYKWQSGRIRIDESTAGELRRILYDEGVRLTNIYKDTELDDHERQLAYFARRRVRRLQKELSRTMGEKGWWAVAPDTIAAETAALGAPHEQHDNPDARGGSATAAHPHLSGDLLEPTP